MSESHTAFDIVIVGGGAAGIASAAALRRARPELQIAIVEPGDEHYYQPGWTLVGGGAMRQQQTVQPQAAVIPDGCTWLKDRVVAFAPDQDQVTLGRGSALSYRYLNVAAGIQTDWHRIDGLEQTLGRNGVTSNYRFDLAPYTWDCVRQFSGGRALFTQPAMPIKCAGAPQKILYLAADHWRRKGVNAEVEFLNQGGAMFGVPLFAKALDGVMRDYGATASFGHDLIAVDGQARVATFRRTEDGAEVTRPFDLLHVCPPQSAPDFIKQSPLANQGGWLEVDPATMRHPRHGNVFALGDCTSTPNAKTAAAVRRQFPVLVSNLCAALDGGEPTAAYDGYGGCPLTTSRGKVMLAEFRYNGEVVPSFPLDPRRPRAAYWWLKRSFFPWLYWHVLLRGRDWHWPEPKPRQFS